MYRSPSVTSTSSASSCGSSSSNNVSRKRRIPEFPARLHSMLENAELEGHAHLISWLPDGKSFKIHVETLKNDGSDDQETFLALIKKYFKQTKLRSFRRQIQNYGFAHILRGPDRGVCTHEFFARGQRELLEDKGLNEFKASSVRRAKKDSVRTLKDFTHSSYTSWTASIEEQMPSSEVSFDGRMSSKTNIPCVISNIPTKLNNLVLTGLEHELPIDFDSELSEFFGDDFLSPRIFGDEIPVPLPCQDKECWRTLERKSQDEECWRTLERKLLPC